MTTKSLAFITSCGILFGLLSFMSISHEFDTVTVAGGQISGTVNTTGDVRIFKGIPFAAPPVGDRRWKAPQPVIPWSGVRKCDAFGSSPVQGSPNPFGPWSAEFLIPKEPISEDCLYLNVWTGAKSATEKKPVLVWIYGGGFNSGGAGVPIYDGEATAKKGVIFVSINYRVGPFGFFSHPELTKESGRNASGNYGLMDQIAALQWVKQNIARFGGDPANVTIAGQSAGSMSVNALVASPLAKNLFTKAIAESGANFSRPTTTLSQAEEAGMKMAQSMGASSLAELRAKPADEILKKGQGRGLVIDGYVLPQPIAAIFAAGQQNDVQLLTGWNEDEGMAFGPPKNADAYRKQLNEQYGANTETFLRFYPAGTDTEAASSQVKVSRDMAFGTQNYKWAMLQSQQGRTAYVYRFARKVPATGEYARYGAFHTGEVAYAYDNLKFIDQTLRPLEPADAQLAKEMSAYWVNFIKRGNPNGKGLPDWPVYSTTNKQIMVFDTKTGSGQLPDGPALDFLLTTMSK
ncbi:carboxylesterase family protein [Spirosoma sp.]|uniref:carboxylesterase/lipase family protein n=1 Tax=Spirosoma sp. TaxID=1899569 RepID=UPI0026090252|nr:carboxylesterase family protein [Spirosoma sp.]MCX6215862.1 carboxylesterase family protein [Spirosoma sp.]